jgi:hypothetical protein
MLLSRYRMLLASTAFLAMASLTAPSLALEATPAAETPAATAESSGPAAQKLAAEIPVAPAAKGVTKSAPAPVAAPAIRAKRVRSVAAKPRVIAPVAVSRPRAAPYRGYRVARYQAPHPVSYHGGGHMIMLGVAY